MTIAAIELSAFTAALEAVASALGISVGDVVLNGLFLAMYALGCLLLWRVLKRIADAED